MHSGTNSKVIYTDFTSTGTLTSINEGSGTCGTSTTKDLCAVLAVPRCKSFEVWSYQPHWPEELGTRRELVVLVTFIPEVVSYITNETLF